MAEAQWSVATIAKESPAVLRRFVSWYLAMGAAEVVIYFDDPNDPSIGEISAVPNVRVIPCTPEFWQLLGTTPGRLFVKRQNLALDHAYRTARFPWLFICDADELLYFRQGRMGEFLAKRRWNIRGVIFQTAEHVIVPGAESETWLRRPMADDLLIRVYGDKLGEMMAQRHGLVGHPTGKSVLRTGYSDIQIRQHFAETPGGERLIDGAMGWKQGAVLLHFMNISYEDWQRKLRFRLKGSSISRKMAVVFTALAKRGDEAAVRALFDQIFTIPAEFVPYLKALRVLVSPHLDPDHAVASYFPPQTVAQPVRRRRKRASDAADVLALPPKQAK